MGNQEAVAHGDCALCREHGQFVKSHLLPRALSRPPKAPYIEVGPGGQAKRRSDSWYDFNLCTRKGEDVLEKIDTAGIDELRRQKLVWSGWNDHDNELSGVEFEGSAFRFVEFDNPASVRLFFLSLLWRSAASTIPEFAHIQLGSLELEDLRRRLLNSDPGRPEEYPIQLHQFVTRGPNHAQIPQIETSQLLFNGDGSGGPEVRSFRVYLDGLVAHVLLVGENALPDSLMRLSLNDTSRSPVWIQNFAESRVGEHIYFSLASFANAPARPTAQLGVIAGAINLAWPIPTEIMPVFGAKNFYPLKTHIFEPNWPVS